MRFNEIVHKLTGISCPIFGVSWTPTETERSIAQNIIIFLEPRRVLYSPYEYEMVSSCIHSVVQIKDYLTSALQKIKDDSKLNEYIRAMRNACNKF
jgi:hypothetical protein